MTNLGLRSLTPRQLPSDCIDQFDTLKRGYFERHDKYQFIIQSYVRVCVILKIVSADWKSEDVEKPRKSNSTEKERKTCGTRVGGR